MRQLSTLHAVMLMVLLTMVLDARAAETSYAQLNLHYQLGTARGEIIAAAQQYLRTHPNDGDVRLLLAKCYIDQTDNIRARLELLTLLRQFPDYVDASLVLINLEMSQQNYAQALEILQMAQLYNLTNHELFIKAAQLRQTMAQQKPPLTLDAFNQASTVGVDAYQAMKNLYAAGHTKAAMQQMLVYIQAHPADYEAHFIMGTFYFNHKEYTKARQQLTRVLQNMPQHLDARLVLINVEMTTHHYQAARQLVHTGLLALPHNANLLKKQRDLDQAMRRQPEDSAASARPVAPPVYLNDIGIYQQQYYISDVHQVWDYSTLYYGHQLNNVKVYAKATYDNRFHKQAVQGEFEAFPKITQRVYLDLDFTFANQPNLFPDQSYGIEAYFSNPNPNGLSVSGGGRYNYVDKRHYFTMYTVSVAKEFAQNRFTFRPYYFKPGRGRNTVLYTLDFRHTIRDPFYYFGCIVGIGSSPDLANLTTVNFIVLQNKLINPYINFPTLHDRLIFNFSALYQHQTFITGRVRNWSGGTIGVDWKF